MWIDCAVYLSNHANDRLSVVYGSEEFHYPPAGVAPSVCEFTLHVPRWEPSPDSAEKRRLAAELLAEFQGFGYGDAKRIVIRDFNLEDPEITALISLQAGEEFQGCRFSREKSPHCEWHLFGQAPLSSLRRQVMSRPYRLFPPLPNRRGISH
jgi:hypothetical protein